MPDILQPNKPTDQTPVAPAIQSPNPLITPQTTSPQGVYGAANVTAAINAPQAKIDLTDPYKIRSTIMEGLGVGGVQTNVNQLIGQLNEFDKQARAQQSYLGQQTVAMPVITGQQAYTQEQAALQRQGLAGDLAAQQSYLDSLMQEANIRYQTAEQERGQLSNLILQYPGAKISYGDDVTTAAKKIEKYQSKVADDEYKKTLKETALKLGIKTSGSKKEIEKRLKKYYGSEAEYKKQTEQLDIQAKKEAIRKSREGTKEKEVTLDTSNTGMAKMLQEEINSGQSWANIAAKFEQAIPGSTKPGGTVDKYLRKHFLGEGSDPFSSKESL